jgi:hypothetical protein
MVLPVKLHNREDGPSALGTCQSVRPLVSRIRVSNVICHNAHDSLNRARRRRSCCSLRMLSFFGSSAMVKSAEMSLQPVAVTSIPQEGTAHPAITRNLFSFCPADREKVSSTPRIFRRLPCVCYSFPPPNLFYRPVPVRSSQACTSNSSNQTRHRQLRSKPPCSRLNIPPKTSPSSLAAEALLSVRPEPPQKG